MQGRVSCKAQDCAAIKKSPTSYLIQKKIEIYVYGLSFISLITVQLRQTVTV